MYTSASYPNGYTLHNNSTSKTKTKAGPYACRILPADYIYVTTTATKIQNCSINTKVSLLLPFYCPLHPTHHPLTPGNL